MDENRPSGRGRARGRARTVPQPVGLVEDLGPAGGPFTGPFMAEERADVLPQFEESRPVAPVGHIQSPADPRFKDEAYLKKRWQEFLDRRDYLRTREKSFEKKGTEGDAVTLIANFFQVQFRRTDWVLYQYRVDIEPEQDDVRIRKGILRTLAGEFQKAKYVFDGGHMLFSIAQLDVDPKTLDNVVFKGKDEVEHGPYQVTFKKVKELPWNDADMIQFYNIVMRKMLNELKLNLIGRYYYEPSLMQELGAQRLQIWPGYKTVLRPFESHVMLNVEMCNKVVRMDTVFDDMNKIRRDFPRDKIRDVIRHSVEGTIVMTTYNNKTYRVTDVDFGKNALTTFETKNGPMSFKDYYKNKYGITIQDEKQPLLISPYSKWQLARNKPGDPNHILLVPELCVLTGLTDEMRANFQLMRVLKDKFIVDPGVRVRQLENFMAKIIQKKKLGDELANEWGIRYPEAKMVEVEGRCLKHERMRFHEKEYFDKPADWTNAFRSVKLLKAVPCERWVILISSRDASCLDQLINTMKRVATPLGYQLGNPLRITVDQPNDRGFENAVDDAMARAGERRPDMIVAVLPTNRLDVYAAFKKRCSIQYGIPSQCLLFKNAQKANMSVLTKLVVQMCAKQGGEPWSIILPPELPKKPLMICGYDVYHSGGFSNQRVSVGALVASLNKNIGKYTSKVQLKQKHELSETMAVDFEYVLQQFEKYNNGALPTRIIFYRDGVGEGQLSDVKEKEIESIWAAITKVYGRAEKELPAFTFIVVSKRINVRFWQKKGIVNPIPGTIVDDVITLPERYDFYLVSQVARQGTVSPTSYNVIRDEGSQLSPTTIQSLTYKMCHMYYNWSGTVSVPGVCQYAHKLAYLTGMALNAPPSNSLADMLHFL